MWYLTWLLGTAFACSFTVFNALWLELEADKKSGLSCGKNN